MSAFVIGLTGGVASGKSTALKVMKRMGADVIDADILARKAVEPGSPALKEIRDAFGDVFYGNGRLNRKKLGAIVFRDKKSLKTLNTIIHPRVFELEKKEIARLAKRKKNAVVVVDAPVMIESASHIWKDVLVVMDCTVENQIKRLVTRRGFTRAQALARINSQMPLKEKLKYADYVIKNDGDISELRKNAASVFKTITSDRIKR